MSKKTGNIIFSTNPNFRVEETSEEIETIENHQQQLKVLIDRKQRKGKSVTIVSNFVGCEYDLQELTKKLKIKCGVGGNAKEGEILLQGELRDKVYDLLINLGYSKTKKVGG